MTAEITHTRISLGSQIRAALTEAKDLGQVREWEFRCGGPGALRYRILDFWGNEAELSPGETADWLNQYGYDVRIGKGTA